MNYQNNENQLPDTPIFEFSKAPEKVIANFGYGISANSNKPLLSAEILSTKGFPYHYSRPTAKTRHHTSAVDSFGLTWGRVCDTEPIPNTIQDSNLSSRSDLTS
jgi:hypothetical protein